MISKIAVWIGNGSSGFLRAIGYLFLTAFFAVLAACGVSKKTVSAVKSAKKPALSVEQLIANARILTSKEIVGNTIDGYVLQNNDRVYFEALKALMLGNRDTAVGLFKYYNQLDSLQAAPYYYLAGLYFDENKIKPTLENVKKAAQLAPSNKWVQGMYATLLAFTDDFESAAQIYMRLARENPMNRGDYYTLASDYFQKANQPDKAIAALDTLQKYRPQNDEEVLLAKQKLQLANRNFENAIEIGKQLVEAYPLEPMHHIGLVEIYDAFGQRENALSEVKVLEERYPFNEEVTSYIFGYYLKRRNLEMVSRNLNQYVETADEQKPLSILSELGKYLSENRKDTSVLQFVINATQKIAQEKPKNFVAKRLLASLKLYSQKEKEGIELTEQLIKEQPRNYEVWNTPMSYFLFSGRLDTATNYLKRMEPIFPDSMDIQYHYTLISRSKNDFESGLKHGLKGLDLAQKQKSTDREILFYNTVAEFYNELKRYQESDSAYENLLTIDPDNILALNNYAYFLSERGERLDYALNLSKKALEQENQEPSFLDTYGWILYKLKRYEEAKVFLAKAIVVAGENVSTVIVEHYADNEYQLGNTAEALKLWEAVLKTGQGSELLEKKVKDKKLYE